MVSMSIGPSQPQITWLANSTGGLAKFFAASESGVRWMPAQECS